MKIIKFCLHIRGSEYVVYEDAKGVLRITDGLGDWEGTSERMRNLMDVPTINIPLMIERLEIPRAFLSENACALATFLRQTSGKNHNIKQ